MQNRYSLHQAFQVTRGVSLIGVRNIALKWMNFFPYPVEFSQHFYAWYVSTAVLTILRDRNINTMCCCCPFVICNLVRNEQGRKYGLQVTECGDFVEVLIKGRKSEKKINFYLEGGRGGH